MGLSIVLGFQSALGYGQGKDELGSKLRTLMKEVRALILTP